MNRLSLVFLLTSLLASTANAQSKELAPKQESEVRIDDSEEGKAAEGASVPATTATKTAPHASRQTSSQEMQQDGSPGSEDAGSSPPPAPSERSEVAKDAPARPMQPVAAKPLPEGTVDELRDRALALEGLSTGELDAKIPTDELFDVDPLDPEVVRKEAKALLRSLANLQRPRKHRAATAGAAGAASATESSTTKQSPTRRWQERIVQSQIEFFNLSPRERRTRLAAYDDERAVVEAALARNESAERAAAAERARQAALEAARSAHSEAERLVQEELARLLAIERRHAELEGSLVMKRDLVGEREEAALKLQRRVRELLASHADPEAADELYRQVRERLEKTRERLSGALWTDLPEVPRPTAKNPLAGLTLDLDTKAIEERRARMAREAERLERAVQSAHELRTAQLYTEMRALNELRLSLLPRLPDQRRKAITGFGIVGVQHAADELRQVALTLRYHLKSTLQWARGKHAGAGGPSAFTTGATALQLLLVFIAFVWVKRRVRPALSFIKDRLLQDRQGGLHPRRQATVRGIDILERIERSTLFLVFFWLAHWVLPPEAKDQLEVRILHSAVTWLLGATVVIQLIDAVAATQRSSRLDTSSALRLRSLRLVGRTAAAIGLLLSVSSHLVGEGTIHSWVTTFTWTLVLPFFLLLSYWWRPVVVSRIEAARRKKPFQEWVLDHQQGVLGLFLVGFAGIHLLAQGLVKELRARADELVVTRRLLAYLFQRQLDKKAESDERKTALPLEGPIFDALAPEVGSAQLLAGKTDGALASLIDGLQSKHQGLHAVVGERGAGKTSALDRVAQSCSGAVIVRCASSSLDQLREALAEALGLAKETPLAEVAATVQRDEKVDVVLVDGVERLIQPVIRGISAFDEFVQAIRPASGSVAWVLAFDEAIWHFFEGARGAEPTFDTTIRLPPWSESDIRQLLEERCRAAGIQPNFDLLIPELPEDADDIELQDAIEAAATSYYRLIWDYSDGNPSVALHTFRRSLARTTDGEVMVQLFHAPRTSELEELPDASAFVLRAVVQLGSATADQIANVTKLPERQVLDTLRFGRARGYFDETESGVRITWGWFRPITRYLMRRHLLPTRVRRLA